MKFGPASPADAVGGVTVHTLRQGALVLKKGTAIGPAEVEALQRAGVKEVVVVRLEDGDISEDLAAGGCRQVDTDAALVPVEHLEKQAVLAILVWRNIAADIAATARILDLDDFGTQIGQVDASEWTGTVLLDRENPDVCKRLHDSDPAASSATDRSLARTSAATLAISFPTIIMPSSTPMPGLART